MVGGDPVVGVLAALPTAPPALWYLAVHEPRRPTVRTALAVCWLVGVGGVVAGIAAGRGAVGAAVTLVTAIWGAAYADRFGRPREPDAVVPLAAGGLGSTVAVGTAVVVGVPATGVLYGAIAPLAGATVVAYLGR
ncbi:hypothetical protein BRD17_03495 [Halobacteriales archaeon SW_7_68_16]|nr:MAG: hypothetical protein BRD17_03495 [Halobacteriales archaeon SW_7_68_16]